MEVISINFDYMEVHKVAWKNCCLDQEAQVRGREMALASLTLYHKIPNSNNAEDEASENTVGKGENAGNQHFLLFSHCFLPFFERNSIL